MESFKLAGKAGEALKMSAVWKGRQVIASTFTGALALPPVEEILFGTGKPNIDRGGWNNRSDAEIQYTSGDGLGSQNRLDASLHGGQPVFSFIKCVAPELPLTLTFEHDGASVAEKSQLAVTDAGQTAAAMDRFGAIRRRHIANKTLRIDLAGRWQKFEKLAEQDGNDIVTGVFLPRYNATATLFAVMTVVNTLATLP